ncbi:MAG: polyprenyl synthetase family protein [Rhodospirillales bacterium]|nr:polyprenyl synthetase family protein [Rhodospirillales bacterium]
MVELLRALEKTADLVGRELDRLLVAAEGPRGRVVEAMRAGSLNGGKRLRPFLLLETASLFDVPPHRALNAAVALEMVHCYSLVHDDLPAMDDSDLRRGKPTVHKLFDDATAILAGDGLLTGAFAVLAEEATHPDPAVRCALVASLAQAAGAAGMVGGQMIDLSPQRGQLDLEGITELQNLKTGRLIRHACEAGAILGGAGPAERQALVDYAGALGLAFQIADDLLDVEGTTAGLGKPAQADAALGKATFVGQLGIEGARQRARALVAEAQRSLRQLPGDTRTLCDTATFVVERQV